MVDESETDDDRTDVDRFDDDGGGCARSQRVPDARPTLFERLTWKYATALAIIDRLLASNESLLDAVRAGGRYSDALLRYQDQGVRGQMIPPIDELERLFKAWHDKGHAAIAKAEGRDG